MVTLTDIPERITSRIDFCGTGGCWPWLGYHHRQTGYPYSSLDGRSQLAYRVLLRGVRPDRPA